MLTHAFLVNSFVVWRTHLSVSFSGPSIPTHQASTGRRPLLHYDGWRCPGEEAGPLQADGRGGEARVGRGPAGLRPAEEGGGPSRVSPNTGIGDRAVHKCPVVLTCHAAATDTHNLHCVSVLFATILNW